MNQDRVYELMLGQYAPYWREILAIWIGSIVALAAIEAALRWIGKLKEGEISNILQLVPLLIVMALPALVAFYIALRIVDTHGLIAAMAAMICIPLAGIYAANRLKRILVWLLTGMGQTERSISLESKRSIPLSPINSADRPTLNGKPLD